jgi:hypothetical protein
LTAGIASVFQTQPGKEEEEKNVKFAALVLSPRPVFTGRDAGFNAGPSSHV